MWLMLQQNTPDDYVIATGETRTVRELVQVAFERAGLDWQQYVKIDQAFMRPAEVDLLVGSPEKATKQLGWKPEISFEEMIHMMVDSDIKRLSSMA
jgi:GDPmannose 4,6-dehydratase